MQKGSQIAALAANNVDITTGSAADILGDTAMFTEQDKRQAQINGAAKAYGYDIDALNQQGQGQFAQWQADTNNTAATIRGVSSIAGSAYGAFGAGAGAGATTGGGTTLLNGGSYNGPQSLSTSWAGNNKQISWLGR